MGRAAVLADTQTAITADTVSATIRAPLEGVAAKVAILVDVTVGTAGTLDIVLEWSQDGGITFAIPDTAQAISQFGVGAAAKAESFDVLGTHYRLDYTVVTGPYTLTVRHLAVG